MGERVFRILSIDGGGIRGVFPAHILERIASTFGIAFPGAFDLIAGTSTGAILAASVATGQKISEILRLYREHGSEIFSRKWHLPEGLPDFLPSLVTSVYDATRLRSLLKDVFGNATLGEVSTPLLIPATDVGLGGVHVLKSHYSSAFTRDTNVPLHEAVLASCSAPYFFNPTKVGPYLLADGGVWANNPSLAAVIDAHKRLGAPFESIRVLSLGTGNSRTFYGVKAKRQWGIWNGWKGKKLIGFVMAVQAQSTDNYLRLLLRKDQVLRVTFESDLELPLDDCSQIEDLIARADKAFTYMSNEIEQFFK